MTLFFTQREIAAMWIKARPRHGSTTPSSAGVIAPHITGNVPIGF